MNTKHTPGPWEIRPSSNKNNGTAWRDIVSIGGKFSPSYVGEALDQDARLIAAAPELLAALINLTEQVEALNAQAAFGQDFIAAKTAIAKATGKD